MAQVVPPDTLPCGAHKEMKRIGRNKQRVPFRSQHVKQCGRVMKFDFHRTSKSGDDKEVTTASDSTRVCLGSATHLSGSGSRPRRAVLGYGRRAIKKECPPRSPLGE